MIEMVIKKLVEARRLDEGEYFDEIKECADMLSMICLDGMGLGTRILASSVYVARNETLEEHLEVIWSAINEIKGEEEIA
jgi:hypothetical protein